MKIEIQQVSNNPANTILEVYSDNTRPIWRIWEEDFIEMLTSNQLKAFENGDFKFNVTRQELFNNCKEWYI